MKLSTRTKRAPYSQSHIGLAFAVGAVVFCASYTLQRLFSFVMGEPEPGVVVSMGHTPYYWRVGMAWLHALIAIALTRFAVDNERAEDILRFAPMWVPCIVLPLALLLVGLP